MKVLQFFKEYLKYNYWILTLLTILLDQLVKVIVFQYLFKSMKTIQVFFFFNLTPVWNNGISFGLFNESGQIGRYLFIFIGISFGILIPIISNSWNRIERIGASILAGGAIGNALDRIFYGSVVDFLDFHWHSIHFPTFNFADTFITMGVVLIFFGSIKYNNSGDKLKND